MPPRPPGSPEPLHQTLTDRYGPDRLVPLPGLPAGTSGNRLVAVAPGRYDWIYADVGGAAAGSYEVWLHYDAAVDPEWLVLTGAPRERVRLPVPRMAELWAVRLPDAAGLRLDSVTLVRSVDRDRPGRGTAAVTPPW